MPKLAKFLVSCSPVIVGTTQVMSDLAIYGIPSCALREILLKNLVINNPVINRPLFLMFSIYSLCKVIDFFVKETFCGAKSLSITIAKH